MPYFFDPGSSVKTMIENLNVQPTTQKERHESIDALRGFALLGILMMNIQSFGMIDQNYMNPMAQGPLTGLDYWSWLVAHVFFDSKMMAIFSMLFGAGIVLMWERAKQVQRPFTGLHYRRMFWLLLIGLIHAHLLWHGDILVPYALCGMIVYWVSGWRAPWLITFGIGLLMVGSALSIMSGWSMPHWPEEQIAEMRADWTPSEKQIEANQEIYRGRWLEQLPHRSKTALMMETFLFLFLWIWRAGGLMLLGMAFYKMRIFQAQRSVRFYGIGAMSGLLLGILLILFGVQQFEANEWKMEYSFFQGHQYNWWGSVLVAFGYVCGIMLLFKKDFIPAAFAAVGQMALTNYLMQTIICTFIFYGHGFGLFGKLNRIQLIGIVLLVWIFQLILSPLWLRYFRFGPMEWLWRSLSYWKTQPLRINA